MMNRLTTTIAVTMITASLAYPSDIINRFEQMANQTIAQLTSSTQYPSNGNPGGKYGWLTSSYSGWTSGFFPGLLWQLYNITSNPYYLNQAYTFTNGLAPEQFDTSTHDVGFIVFTSFGAEYKITGNSTAKAIVYQTAQSLATRYSPIVHCTQSWGVHPPPNHQFEVIADNMMNLELLWWTGYEFNNQTLLDIANNHSHKMITDLFQPFLSGVVWHLIIYNDTTGDILSRSSTPQGLAVNSVWSRGQAWIVNGFTIAYRFTQNNDYLLAAQNASDAFIRLLTNCCGNTVYNWAPFWDFNVTAPNINVDTSAAMIATSGIIELAWYTTDSNKRSAYLAFAKTVLDEVTANYMFDPSENDAVLKNGTVTYPTAGISIIYADYYLLQAITRWEATPTWMKDEATSKIPFRLEYLQ